MAEARKIFSMDTFISYLKNDVAEEQKKSVTELLSFMVQQPVSDEFAPYATALTKAWVYEQHPNLTNIAKGQASELGESVSVAPVSVRAKSQIDEIFALLTASTSKIGQQEKDIASLKGELAEKATVIAELEKKIKKLESVKKDNAEALFVTTEKRIEEFTGKLETLLKQVDEVKKTGIVVAGVVGTSTGGGATSTSAPTDGAPGSDFGFGGGAADPFSSTDW